jgi:hypothetical protein
MFEIELALISMCFLGFYLFMVSAGGWKTLEEFCVHHEVFIG